MKLGRLGLRGTGHARKLFVKSKIILQSDRGKCLVFALNLDVFLCFNRLVQAIRPATALHQPTREVINDDYFAVLHYVLMIELVKRMRLQSLFDAMQQLHIRRLVEVANPEQPLSLIDALFGEHGGMIFLIDNVVSGLLAFFQLFATDELGND